MMMSWMSFQNDTKKIYYRKSIGPNIPLWVENECPHAIFGLQFDLDFGTFGNVRGICTYFEESDEFQIEWRHGPDFNKKTPFISKHGCDKEILGMYVQDKYNSNKVAKQYEWMEYITPMKESLLDFLKTVRCSPEGSKFVNWKQPFHLDDDPDSINIVDEDEWFFTMAKLNDPRMAYIYIYIVVMDIQLFQH